jgi:hypothetical protein
VPEYIIVNAECLAYAWNGAYYGKNGWAVDNPRHAKKFETRTDAVAELARLRQLEAFSPYKNYGVNWFKDSIVRKA